MYTLCSLLLFNLGNYKMNTHKVPRRSLIYFTVAPVSLKLCKNHRALFHISKPRQFTVLYVTSDVAQHAFIARLSFSVQYLFALLKGQFIFLINQ